MTSKLQRRKGRPPLGDITNTHYRPRVQTKPYFPAPPELLLACSPSQSLNEGKIPREEVVDKTKYKTEMCKNWIEVGVCRYGTKCQFAHGDFELLGKAPPVTNGKYKSKVCTTFAEKLFCPYGQRCLFRHEDRPFEQVKQLSHVHRLLLNQPLLKRLPIFQQMTNGGLIMNSNPLPPLRGKKLESP